MDDLESQLRASLNQPDAGLGAQGKPATTLEHVASPRTPSVGRLISATRIAAIVGVAPKSWKSTPLSVYRELVDGVQPKRTPSELKRLTRGNTIEPYLRGLYLEETGGTLAPQMEVHAHPEHEWATCSPDAIVDHARERAVVDFKSWSRWAAHKFGAGDADIPPVYLCQLAWSMFVLGLDRAQLFVAFGEDDPEAPGGFVVQWTRTYRLSRDPELEASLVEAGRRFWFEHVVPRIPPEVA